MKNIYSPHHTSSLSFVATINPALAQKLYPEEERNRCVYDLWLLPCDQTYQ